MCVIIGTIGKEKVSDKEIREAWQGNSDGAGIAWRDGSGKIRVEKGFMKLKEFEEAYAKINVFPHVLHFRIGTSGDKCPELTHPFPCDGHTKNSLEFTADEVLFHNGIVSNWKDLLFTLAPALKKGELKRMLAEPLNDTRVIAYYVERIGKEILGLADGKWLHFDKNNLTTYGQGWEKEGKFFYSNTSFRHTVRRFTWGNNKSGSNNWDADIDYYSHARSEERQKNSEAVVGRFSLFKDLKERYAK